MGEPHGHISLKGNTVRLPALLIEAYKSDLERSVNTARAASVSRDEHAVIKERQSNLQHGSGGEGAAGSGSWGGGGGRGRRGGGEGG